MSFTGDSRRKTPSLAACSFAAAFSPSPLPPSWRSRDGFRCRLRPGYREGLVPEGRADDHGHTARLHGAGGGRTRSSPGRRPPRRRPGSRRTSRRARRCSGVTVENGVATVDLSLKFALGKDGAEPPGAPLPGRAHGDRPGGCDEGAAARSRAARPIGMFPGRSSPARSRSSTSRRRTSPCRGRRRRSRCRWSARVRVAQERLVELGYLLPEGRRRAGGARDAVRGARLPEVGGPRPGRPARPADPEAPPDGAQRPDAAHRTAAPASAPRSCSTGRSRSRSRTTRSSA